MGDTDPNRPSGPPPDNASGDNASGDRATPSSDLPQGGESHFPLYAEDHLQADRDEAYDDLADRLRPDVGGASSSAAAPEPPRDPLLDVDGGAPLPSSNIAEEVDQPGAAPDPDGVEFTTPDGRPAPATPPGIAPPTGTAVPTAPAGADPPGAGDLAAVGKLTAIGLAKAIHDHGDDDDDVEDPPPGTLVVPRRRIAKDWDRPLVLPPDDVARRDHIAKGGERRLVLPPERVVQRRGLLVSLAAVLGITLVLLILTALLGAGPFAASPANQVGSPTPAAGASAAASPAAQPSGATSVDLSKLKWHIQLVVQKDQGTTQCSEHLVAQLFFTPPNSQDLQKDVQALEGKSALVVLNGPGRPTSVTVPLGTGPTAPADFGHIGPTTAGATYQATLMQVGDQTMSMQSNVVTNPCQ